MEQTKWVVDSSHSCVAFMVRHMMIAKVKGTFYTFEAYINANPTDLTTANVHLNVDVRSIDTRNAERDKHLLSRDFFHVEQHPKMIFQSTHIAMTGKGKYDMTGDLTLHGVTRSETFSVTFEGAGKDPLGNEKIRLSGQGTIKRSNYGLTYNAVLETGGVLIGDEIKISIELEASKQESRINQKS